MTRRTNVYDLPFARYILAQYPDTRLGFLLDAIRLSEREVGERARRQSIVAVIDVATGEVHTG